MAKDSKILSKIRKRAVEKRVVSVPIENFERSKLKGHHISSPPSDSWAWRKYGQKPIKGSPYPRGYYKCSSSKACPAKKQVERCRLDPTMLIVTYSCEHNHPSPSSRNLHHCAAATFAGGNTCAATLVSEDDLEKEADDGDEEEEKPANQVRDQSHELISDNRCSIFGEGIDRGEFAGLTEFESTSFNVLEIPVLMEETDEEMAMIFPMREEDESDLFADLGELPECSTVFRHGMAKREVQGRRGSLATTD